MNQPIDIKLVDTTDETKDFKTIDLEKIKIDTESSEKYSSNSHEDVKVELKSVGSEDVENKMKNGTLNESISETLVITYIKF
jgi:hypothetical protein